MDFKLVKTPNSSIQNLKMMISGENLMVMNREGLMVRPETREKVYLVDIVPGNWRDVMAKVHRSSFLGRRSIAMETEDGSKFGFFTFENLPKTDRHVLMTPSDTIEVWSDTIDVVSSLDQRKDSEFVSIVVRNPYDRIWSSYHENVRGSLEDFVMNMELRPIVESICRELTMIDYVVRFESLKLDMAWLSKMMGNIQIDYRHYQDEVPPIDMSYFTQDMLDKVNDCFADDFKSFGYAMFRERAIWW